MKNLVRNINKLKKTEVKEKIDKRIKQFKNLNKKGNKEWFSELCFCLLTANWKAKGSISLQKELCKDGFFSFSQKKLESFLKKRGHRFWPQRAERICLARKNIDIKNIIRKHPEPREWLVKNIKGLGYKEASHFLRNVGYEDYAILDRHIMKILEDNNIIQAPKTLTKKRYLDAEQKLKQVGKKVNLSQAELDLYLWYMKTGEILK